MVLPDYVNTYARHPFSRNRLLVSNRGASQIVVYVAFLSDFDQESFMKMVYLGDTAMNARRHDEAICYYTTVLSLNPPCPQDTLIKRSKMFVATGSWKQALDDANKVYHYSLMEVDFVDVSSGDRTRSVVAMGLRNEACSSA